MYAAYVWAFNTRYTNVHSFKRSRVRIYEYKEKDDVMSSLIVESENNKHDFVRKLEPLKIEKENQN